MSLDIVEKIKSVIGWKRGERAREKRAKRSFVVFIGLFLSLVVSIVFHNLLTAVFGYEELVFFVISIALVLILPIYLVYTTVVVIDYLLKKYIKFK